VAHQFYALKGHYIMYRQRKNTLSKVTDQRIFDIFKALEIGQQEMSRLSKANQQNFFNIMFLTHAYLIQFTKLKGKPHLFLIRFSFYKKIKQKIDKIYISAEYLEKINVDLKNTLHKAYQEIRKSNLIIIFVKLFWQSLQAKFVIIRKL